MTQTVSNKNILFEWDELCLFKQKSFQNIEILRDIQALKQAPPEKLISLSRQIIKISPGGYTWKKFKDLSWSDAVDLLHDTLLRNLNTYEHDPERKISSYVNRKHNQQPCTYATAERRVKKISEICRIHDPILILGDDDYMGIHLARAGFRNVTALDIDPVICHGLVSKATEEGLKLKILHHDIRNSISTYWQKPYKLIFMDPMYSIAGLKMFLDSAIKFSAHHPTTTYFLNVHLLSLLRSGLIKLPDLLLNLNLELFEFLPAFNHYPIPPRLDSILSLFNRMCMRTQVMAAHKGKLGFFISDALLLQKVL